MHRRVVACIVDYAARKGFLRPQRRPHDERNGKQADAWEMLAYFFLPAKQIETDPQHLEATGQLTVLLIDRAAAVDLVIRKCCGQDMKKLRARVCGRVEDVLTFFRRESQCLRKRTVHVKEV